MDEYATRETLPGEHGFDALTGTGGQVLPRGVWRQPHRAPQNDILCERQPKRAEEKVAL